MDKNKLVRHYSKEKDSLTRKSAVFLIENMEDQTSDVPDEDAYSIFPDSEIIDNRFLTEDIEKAVNLWNRYPWADSVPEDVFMNSLLPYKVYGEEPSEWRKFFEKKYADTVRIMLKELESDTLMQSSNEVYYCILINEVGQCFKYENHPTFKVRYPGFRELMRVKTADCFG
ncbi:MAG: hypothetical protein LBS46_05740 [Dysgonamonadaceae bacterium]|nr:hypothetical protein [Dysgonamonadaceae bacterium]